MIGYLTAGVTINFFSAYVTWRFSIQIQGVVQIPISFYFFFEDAKYINVETTNVKGKKNSIQCYFPKSNIAKTSPFKKTNSERMAKKKIISPAKELTKSIRRQKTRIDAVEINHLTQFFIQTQVYPFITDYQSCLGGYE